MTKKTCSQMRGCKNIPIWCYRFHSNDTFFSPVIHPQLDWTIKIYVGRWKTLQQQWLRTRKPTLECWHWSAHIDHQMSKSSSSWSLLKKKIRSEGKQAYQFRMQNATVLRNKIYTVDFQTKTKSKKK